jgi:hypothetical protein
VGKGRIYIDSEYSGHSEVLRKSFEIKNTIMKMIKYGIKDVYRFWNESLLEKYDDQNDSIEKLRGEPLSYGNQKRKRQLKYFDKVQDLISRIKRTNKNQKKD